MRFLKFTILFILLLCVFDGYGQPIKFYSSDRDLSNSMATKIIQDSHGFIWIATEDGLNRYDGIKFKTYQYNRNDITSLTSNFVRTLFEDSHRRLWIGCINGLMRYNPDNESFIEIKLFRDTLLLKPHITSIIESKNGDLLIATSGHGLVKIKNGAIAGYADLKLNSGLSSEFLECLLEDSSGRLWIGSENEGINLYNPVNNKIEIFRKKSNQSNSLSSNYITAICEDSLKRILIGTLNGGINMFIEKENGFRKLSPKPNNNTDLPVKSLYVDQKRNIWVGTDGKGLWKIDPKNDSLEPKDVTTTRFDVNKSKIHSIIEDNEGNLWLGIFQKGILMVRNKPNRFNTYSYQQFGQKSIGSGCIMAIKEDSNGQIWVGSEGIYNINHQTSIIQHFTENLTCREKIKGTITSICIDKEKGIWMGTLLEGLLFYNPKTGNCQSYKHFPENINSLANDKVQSLTQDVAGNLWIGTSGGGLNRFNPQTGIFTRFQNNPDKPDQTICNNWVNTVFCDSEGLLWVGTYNRVTVINPKTETFRMLSTANGLLPNNIVFCFTEDNSGNIWIGTNEGLVCYNKNSNTSKFYTTEDGLCNNVICAILQDNHDNLWISTHKGISKFSIADSVFSNYYVTDGLQGNEFRRNSATKTKKGELFFGGINGITWFLPENITTDNYIPNVYLTDLILFNKTVQIGEKTGNRTILKKSFEKTDTLVLSYQDKTFSIEFSIIGFSNPERISYQYMLDGFDNKWISTNVANRRATYTNLGSGKYTFKVRAADKTSFSDIRELMVLITPPWWSSWWFKTIYIILGILVLLSVFIFVQGRIKQRNELLLLEHHEKINEAKLQLFTNISHEIRTPLTLIAGPLEKLIAENKDQNLTKSYRLMSQNTHRLLRLVNQLIDIRKIDQGQLQICYAQTELVSFISEIMHAFEYLAEKKQISFIFLHDIDELQVWIDPDNFDKVIYNVLANAFKFTPDRGTIEIKLYTFQEPVGREPRKVFAKIVVTDSGPGIEKSKIERIFDRFYQIENQQNINPGTGIGLHLSRTLVEMMHGTITAENRTGVPGSVFIISVPVRNLHTQFTESLTQQEPYSIKNEQIPNSSNAKTKNEYDERASTEPKLRGKTNYKILLVDDDDEIRNYLKTELAFNFRILECNDGKEAIDCVLRDRPDLIICDIMMPVMDGITLCRRIKSNPTTSHLPVVLLTARSEAEGRAEGFDTGADAYFVKPFSIDLLRKNIYNLLENRERIKIRYSPGGNIVAGKQPFSSADETLMTKIMLIIEENIGNQNLGAEFISKEIGMSRVHLHRKLKKITGQSATDFIRKIRLQKAAHLLTGNKGFIKEVAFEVGFTSLSHFSRSFHEFYGVAPSEFIERNLLQSEKESEY